MILISRLFIVILILISANPHFSYNDDYLIFFAILGSFIAFAIDSQKKINFKAISFALFFISFEILHNLVYDFYPRTILRIILHFLIAYSVVKISGKYFIDNYIKIIKYFALISLFFYVLIFFEPVKYSLISIAELFPVKEDYRLYSTPTIIFYTFDSSAFTNFPRNAGFAWEAGGFVSFLLPALFFKLMRNYATTNRFYFDNDAIIILVAIITTFSTAGFIALIICFLVFSISKISLKTLARSIVLVGVVVVIFINAPFLKDKINKEIYYGIIEQRNNRLGSFLLDLPMIKEKPLLGWSRKIENQFGISDESTRVDLVSYYHRPNGISRMLVAYGFIFFIGYFFLYYKGVKIYAETLNINKNKAMIFGIVFVIIILTISFAQLLFDKVFFKSLLFLYPVILSMRNELFQNINNRRIIT